MVIDSLTLIGISSGLFAATLGVIYWAFAPQMPFLYSNARIQARSKYLVGDARIASLSDMKNLTEFINSMQDTEYADAIENPKNIRELHIAIEKGFINSIIELKETSPEKLNKLFDAYLMFWESKIIKTFYRQRFSKMDHNIDDSVFPIGTINANIIKHLHEAKTIADLKVVMNNTFYKEVFEKDYKNLEEFEVCLDNLVYKNFVEVISKIKVHDANEIIKIFNTKFDILNLLVLLKCEARDVDEEKRKKLLIENNTELAKRQDKLIYAKGVADLVELCKGLEYYPALEIALQEYAKDNSLSHFEMELMKYYKKSVLGKELYHSQGAYPLFSYLTKKELEQRNLLIISKGIDSGFTNKEIKELII